MMSESMETEDSHISKKELAMPQETNEKDLTKEITEERNVDNENTDPVKDSAARDVEESQNVGENSGKDTKEHESDQSKGSENDQAQGNMKSKEKDAASKPVKTNDRDKNDNPADQGQNSEKSSANDATVNMDTTPATVNQSENQKEVTDEDVLQQLEAIEDVLDLQDVNIKQEVMDVDYESQIKTEPTERNEEESMDVSGSREANAGNDVVVVENPWYEEKLREKVITIKERLSKLARVLEFSYPSYQKWLAKAEKEYGSPMCKLDPARACPLDRPYTNRWKFICSRKSVQDSSKEENNVADASNKNAKTVWRLESTGAWGVNTENESEFPPFVLRAVKVFEEFLQTTEESEKQNKESNETEDQNKDANQKDTKQQWLWLLVRCNSMDELMLFATGKNITQSTMDSLKAVFESGPGKDCNVKSLYCKTANKSKDSNNTVTNTIFLLGSEALDEVVGGVKVQLAPKTNFWSNAAGAENVAQTVADLLEPNAKTTVIEIGCGIGLIGLMMASKCQKVIGIDSQSEIEEAEMTCKLNAIKNAAFIVGSTMETTVVTNKINAVLKNCKSYAIINANTNIGRSIDVMICLRKNVSLRKLVMVTTLTKQSVRAILELTRPADKSLGNPFIPIRACVVDTLPVGPHFEVIILMERRLMSQIAHASGLNNLSENLKEDSQVEASSENILKKDKIAYANKANALLGKRSFDKTAGKVPPMKKIKVIPPAKKGTFSNIQFMNNKTKGKPSQFTDKSDMPPKKMGKKFDKFGNVRSTWRPDQPSKKEETLRLNLFAEKRLREAKETEDLREKLSAGRGDSSVDILQTVKEQKVVLEVAKEKLSGSGSNMDVQTAKQLHEVLNKVLEQTTKLQSQLPVTQNQTPRNSVWDRIAPAEDRPLSPITKDRPLKGRFVQETGTQDIVITTSNIKFEPGEPKASSIRKKYNNLPPLEPNLVMPTEFGKSFKKKKKFRRPLRLGTEDWPKPPLQVPLDGPSENWDEEIEAMEQRRFSPKRPSPHRDISPAKRHYSPPRRPPSPFRPRDSPPRRYSPPRHRDFESPPRRPMSPIRRGSSPPKRGIGTTPPSLRRVMSPSRRQLSPSRRKMSPPRRQISPPRRQMSPPRRQISPPRRQMSPLMRRPVSPSWRAVSPMSGRPASPVRRQMSPPRRPMSPPNRDVNMISHDRRISPPMRCDRQLLSPPRRQSSPPRRFADEWDIPTRGAVEQNIWPTPRPSVASTATSGSERRSEKTWHNDRSRDDRMRKHSNQDSWDIKESSREGMWNSSEDTWNKSSSSSKMPINTDNRWSNASNSASTSDNWNIRGKESFPNSRDDNRSRWEPTSKESWHQDKDYGDLPEDARDPWGDDCDGPNLKDRWSNFEGPPQVQPTPSWDKGDPRMKPNENWQHKGPSLAGPMGGPMGGSMGGPMGGPMGGSMGGGPMGGPVGGPLGNQWPGPPINLIPGDPRSNDPRVNDPRMNDPRMNDPRMNDPRMNDPRMNDPRMGDPRMSDPRINDPRLKDPRWVAAQNEMKKTQLMSGWPGGNMPFNSNAPWPPGNLGFQQPRPFNVNPYKDRL